MLVIIHMYSYVNQSLLIESDIHLYVARPLRMEMHVMIRVISCTQPYVYLQWDLSTKIISTVGPLY